MEMIKMKCKLCGGTVEKKRGVMEEDNVEYEYFKCLQCGEEYLDMDQLEKVAAKYRKLREAKDITFRKWGNSIAVRIPKEIVDALNIASGKHGKLFREKNGLKIVVE
jgi:hypothetical protein